MKKVVFSILPFLFACHSATHQQLVDNLFPAEDSVAAASAANTDQVVYQPKLQAVKWTGIKEMTDESFKKDVLASSSVTLVDFTATWCGPCRLQKPILEKLVKEYAGKINFASVDVDDCPETAAFYQVQSIPTLAFYQNAQEGEKVVGLTDYESLKELIENKLKE